MSSSDYSNPSGSEGPRSAAAATEETVHTSGGASGVDAEAVREAKAEIHALVNEIADLSRSDVSADEFYDALLNRVVQALAAIGGAVWTLGETGGLRLQYHINLPATGLIESEAAQQQHGRLLTQVLREEQGMLVAPHSGAGGTALGDEEAAGNPTDCLLVLAPVHNDEGPQGIVEVFQRTGARLATQRGYLNFLQQMCELAGDYLKGQRLRHFSSKQSLWEQLESFTRTAHQSLDVKQSAFTIANEGRRLIGCDRVSVAISRGGRCRIQAVSGQDMFDKRSNVVALLSRLSDAVTATGEDVWYTGDTSDLAPQVEDALDAYVDESHAKAVAVLPLVRPIDEEELRAEGEDLSRASKAFGALIVEQMVDSRPPEGLAQRVAVVRQHGATALANALEHESLFLMPLWKTLGKATWLVRARTLPKTITITALIVGVILFAALWPADFELEGRGELQPKTRRFVYAQIDAEVDETKVDHGDVVAEGAPLVTLSSQALEKELTETIGQIKEVESKIASLEKDLNDSSIRRTNTEKRQLNMELGMALESRQQYVEELSLLNEQRALLEVHAPIGGEVVTWQVRERLQLGRPLKRGDQLMEIAKTGDDADWVIEVLMPEHRMGHITEAMQDLAARKQAGEAPADERLPVRFILATHPEEEFTGYVAEIERSAEVRDEDGNSVKLTVEFDPELLDTPAFKGKRPAAGVTARVQCGRASIGYVWLHDLIGWFQSEVLFRL